MQCLFCAAFTGFAVLLLPGPELARKATAADASGLRQFRSPSPPPRPCRLPLRAVAPDLSHKRTR